MAASPAPSWARAVRTNNNERRGNRKNMELLQTGDPAQLGGTAPRIQAPLFRASSNSAIAHLGIEAISDTGLHVLFHPAILPRVEGQDRRPGTGFQAVR